MAEERLQKIIARAGFASRREAEELIRAGKVTINGQVVTELGTKADGARDHVKVEGKLITRPEEKRYILLNKPKEIMTTLDDPKHRKTVLDLVRGVKERIYPVGRLDYHSEGLILLTNDGDLAFKIAHPSQGSVKTYNVKVRGIPSEKLLEKLARGITIDGRRTRPCEIDRLRTTGRSDDEGNSWFEVRLREGRTQQIRKMFGAVGHPVSKLKRVAIGPLSDNKLPAGQWRELTKAEVSMLYRTGEKTPVKQRIPAKRPQTSIKKTPSAAPKKRPTRSKAPVKKGAAPSSPRKERTAAPRKAARTSAPRKARRG